MIEEARGNLLQADVEALVNTVNCVGYMGRGIALQFRQAFPANYEAYVKACRAGEVQPGRVLVYETDALMGPRYIINVPTKRHWRGRSRYDDVEAGLSALAQVVRERGIRSVAVPPLGCGLGGLDWRRVRSMIQRAFAELPEVRVLLYTPSGTPEPQARPIHTPRPTMTRSNAVVIRLMEIYGRMDYRLTLLEVQKLAYFAQEAGEPLRLRYEQGPYGPYADNLNQVLLAMESHYTQGYTGGRKPDEEIALVEGAADGAAACLAKKRQTLQRLDRVAALVDGFETPYGMELLSSVHWVAKTPLKEQLTADDVVGRVHAWNTRKRRLLRQDHIHIAWEHLRANGWIT
ncbi:MAG TPA: macro domain-containing protein [Armatimonadota bacterium]|nr:macro domain-containing protein [Armatimonadota bacterium]HQK91985.1 macro domain-containing protein [Armatimonadota bacterium]